MTDIGYKKRKWKPNPMVPATKLKRNPIELNYLEERRRSNGAVLDRDQIKYKPIKWQKELKDKDTLDKFDYVFDKAQQISANQDMEEQYLRYG